jgi:hypothetical protein
MLGNFLRNNVYAAALITVLRVYVGWKWMNEKRSRKLQPPLTHPGSF